MNTSTISRRQLFGMGLGVAAAAHSPAPAPLADSSAASYSASIENAIAFQNRMMDAYAGGSNLRLIQSYSDGGLGATSFTYDDAVSLHAYLVHGSDDDLQRAQILGDSLIYAQAHNFPFNDGRFAQAYFVNTPTADGAYITPAAFPFYFYGSAVGDQAWAGMALAQLYRRTGESRYLDAALKVANWIVANTYSTLGPGGYSFGTIINQYNQSVPSPNGKSTEHNIDTYAFFTMLKRLTGNAKAANGTHWGKLARHALDFVLAMYNSAGGYFYTGTLGDQITINPSPIPEDCQTWSYLALLDRSYAQTIDWAIAHLQTTDTAASPHSSLTGTQSINGMVFDTASLAAAYPGSDPNAVWLEGTAHTIARITSGGEPPYLLASHIATALRFLSNSQTAQSELGGGRRSTAKSSLSAKASSPPPASWTPASATPMAPSLHIGATGWYLIAALGGNPFQLGYTRNG